MLCLLLRLRDWVADLKVRRAAQRYRRQLSVIERLDIPEDFKQAAKDHALRQVGETLEHYTDPE
jgi:hypothetical protein